MTFTELMNERHGLTITPAMQKELNEFDPKVSYGGKDENLQMSQTSHKILVGRVSNLVCDMMAAGAGEEELIRVLKYGAVIIDTVKYGLDYEQAAKDFGFYDLKQKYYKYYSTGNERRN